MKSKGLVIKFDALKISGEITFPDNFNFKTVILAHGFSNDRHQRGQFDDLRAVLLKNGYCVVWFDFPGTGKSTGKFEDTTLARQRKTLKSVIDNVYKIKGIDNTKIGLVAVSFSSVSAIILNSSKIKTYVLASVNANPYKVISELFINSYGNEKVKNEFNPNGISTRTNGVGQVLKLKSNFWKSVKGLKLKDELKEIIKPKLFIHGSKDLIASHNEAIALYKFASIPKKFVTIKGAGHNYDESSKVRTEMINTTLKWFEVKL